MRISDWSSDVCSSDLQLSDRKACAIRFRFFQRQAKILPHPFDSKAEIELAVRHGERAVVHLPALRSASRNDVDDGRHVQSGAFCEMHSLRKRQMGRAHA